MFGYSSEATAILGAVILSVVLTLALFASRLLREFPGSCLIGLGLTPLQRIDVDRSSNDI